MRIFFVTPEAVPCSRAGGLGDVLYHLPRTLHKMGHQVTVLAPRHRLAEDFDLEPLPKLRREIDLSISRRVADYSFVKLPGAHDLVLVGCDDLFDRPGIYGNEFGDYDDNAERFIFFSKASFGALKDMALSKEGEESGQEMTAVHCHDWSTGLIPMFFKVSGDPTLSKIGTVFTYHNLANQGTFPYFDFTMTGLDWSHFTYQGLEFHGQVNLTKAGLLGAHLISTVSHRYARETLGPELGQGLEGVIKERRRDLRSVLHGVDYELWNPASDRYLPAAYDMGDLEGKKTCRDNLTALFGLDNDERPIVAVVSRFLARKGLDLIAKAMPRLLTLPMRLVLMGTGDDYFISVLRETALNHPGQVGLKLSHDPSLSHQIIAGADILLVPSRFEPCGLEQLYALKYGTIPVVRATGGLDDTVIDEISMAGQGTGFKFGDYTDNALVEALRVAISHHRGQDAWRALMVRAMGEDYSWERAAAAYAEIYQQALERAAAARGREGS
ncbi:MAG: glycogen synthase [Deltaproteobacteria bacterium]|jgi:starch synthase|nr:glycogen synthase [Deltaproteobacteria bacterium]